LARFYLDFSRPNAGLTPPAFVWFRDATNHADLPPPPVFATPSPDWRYYFDYSFPIPNFPSTTSVEWGIKLGGVALSDVTVQPGGQPTRFYVDFGSTNGGLEPGAGSGAPFVSYRDAVTLAAITAPALRNNAAPAWNYFFDAVFPSGTSQISFSVSLAGVNLSDVIVAPIATLGFGGAMTLADLKDTIRFEADLDGDPNIDDTRLVRVINQSRLRLFDKLIEAYDSRYFTSKAVFTTFGGNFQ